jgi:flagellar motor protein MotB
VVSTASTISKSNKIIKQQQQQPTTTTLRRFHVLKWLVESLEEEENEEANIGDGIDKRNDALYVFSAAGLAGKRLLHQQQKDDNKKQQQHHKEQKKYHFHQTTSSLSSIQNEDDAFAIISSKES